MGPTVQIILMPEILHAATIFGARLFAVEPIFLASLVHCGGTYGSEEVFKAVFSSIAKSFLKESY